MAFNMQVPHSRAKSRTNFHLRKVTVLIVLVNPGMKSQMKMTCFFLRKRLFFGPNHSNKYW